MPFAALGLVTLAASPGIAVPVKFEPTETAGGVASAEFGLDCPLATESAEAPLSVAKLNASTGLVASLFVSKGLGARDDLASDELANVFAGTEFGDAGGAETCR